MDKVVIALFESDAQAYKGFQAFKSLQQEGSLDIKNIGVIAKDMSGQVSVQQAPEPVPSGALTGALVGMLIGILAGPVGVVVGGAGGALVGGVADLHKLGIGDRFISKVEARLQPGTYAVVAEIDEGWEVPLDEHMAPLGGFLIREPLMLIETAAEAEELADLQVSVDKLKSEYKQASTDAKEKVKGKLDKAQAELQQKIDHVNEKLNSMQAKAQDKIEKLSQKSQHASESAHEKAQALKALLQQKSDQIQAKIKKAKETLKS